MGKPKEPFLLGAGRAFRYHFLNEDIYDKDGNLKKRKYTKKDKKYWK